MSNQIQARCVVVTDCGSTTTKAICFAIQSGAWRVISRAEAPTTVEKPVADVTIGVSNALRAIGKELGIQIVYEEHSSQISLHLEDVSSNDTLSPQEYLSTSSAGGGLQMVVLGLVSKITAKSAERAALGAGAIVQNVYSLDSSAEPYEAADRIRELRPDIVILSGGTDGGAEKQILDLCELLLLAEPKSRFETDHKVPLVYAGNQNIKNEVYEVLKNVFDVKIVDNIRPTIEDENLLSARSAVHDIFLDHVMSQAPGYQKLQSLVTSPIVPTPVAVSNMIEQAAKNAGKTILAVDIGGATTDIFSIRRKKNQAAFRDVHRSVSANLGMSYSIGNVVALAGLSKIKRWLPFHMDDDNLRDVIWNKMIRPTSLPESMEDLLIEHAVAREALRLSLDHHIDLDEADGADRVGKDLSDIFKTEEKNVFSMLDLDIVIGSGGVLSHAPNRANAFMMIVDSFCPQGVTFIGLDSIFMLPHLGVLSGRNSAAALELLYSECIIPLGTYVSPQGKVSKYRKGELLYVVYIEGESRGIEVTFGDLILYTLPRKSSQKMRIEIKKKDLVFSKDNSLEFLVDGGDIGLVLDGRLGAFDILLRENSISQQRDWHGSLSASMPSNAEVAAL